MYQSWLTAMGSRVAYAVDALLVVFPKALTVRLVRESRDAAGGLKNCA